MREFVVALDLSVTVAAATEGLAALGALAALAAAGWPEATVTDVVDVDAPLDIRITEAGLKWGFEHERSTGKTLVHGTR